MRTEVFYLVLEGSFNPYLEVALIKCLICGIEVRDEIVCEVAQAYTHASEEHDMDKYILVYFNQEDDDDPYS